MSNYKHGMKGEKIYGIWCAMIARCHNSAVKAYKNYGGRGIQVCERWRTFENFYADMGGRPDGKSLDRIDNDKGYSPENCRWVERKTQNRNRRGVRLVTANGVTKSLGEWAEIKGIAVGTLSRRLKTGWEPEKAINTPVITKRKGIRRGEALRDHV